MDSNENSTEEHSGMSSSGTTPMALDISGRSIFAIHTTGINNGLKFIDYFPKPGYRITSVLDNGWVIWKADGDHERCIFAEVYKKKDIIILSLNITRKDDYEPTCFKKVGKVWMNITVGDYFAKIEEMRTCPE